MQASRNGDNVCNGLLRLTRNKFIDYLFLFSFSLKSYINEIVRYKVPVVIMREKVKSDGHTEIIRLTSRAV